MTLCTGCDRPTSLYLCKPCASDLAYLYRQLPYLLADLATTAYRHDKLGSPGGGKLSKGAERPMPYKLAAADLLHTTTEHLLDRAKASGVATPIDRTYKPPQDDRAWHRLCVALRFALAEDCRTDAKIGTTLAVLHEDALRIRVMIDYPVVQRFLGQCDDCHADLYAPRDNTEFACPSPACDRVYPVAERMADLIERARDVVTTAPTIARALTSLDVPVTEDVIRQWKSRGLLVPVRTVGQQPHYRVGDVIDLVVKRRQLAHERGA